MFDLLNWFCGAEGESSILGVGAGQGSVDIELLGRRHKQCLNLIEFRREKYIKEQAGNSYKLVSK